ncbi:hypothetical protein Hanom_Chr16g01496501 [Helianthus anomalus]
MSPPEVFSSAYFFFERQIWITDGSLEYHRATSETTRSYPSPLGIMPIHQFRRKPNKYGKNPLWESNPEPIGPKALSHPQMPLGYKAMGIFVGCCGNRWFCHAAMMISKVFFQLILAWQ